MSIEPLSEALLRTQDECTLIWRTRDGSCTGTIVSYFADGGHVWMTAAAGSIRARALARDPRTALVITGKGSALGHARCVTLRGETRLHRDAATRDWFFPRFAKAVLPDSERGQAGMARSMNNEGHLVLEFIPERTIPYDAHDQMVGANRL
jgi:hypothetical protein